MDCVQSKATSFTKFKPHRHAQGFHNVAGEKDYESYQKEEYEDALLTPHGEAQCEDLKSHRLKGNFARSADLLVVSPMRRTLATASIAFRDLSGSIPWVAHESLREQAGYHPCDRRRPISELRESYPHVDFTIIQHDKDPLYFSQAGRESAENVTKRAFDFFTWLDSRTEKEIVVVTHSAFLHSMFKSVVETDLLGEGDRCGVFSNCEMKSYLIDSACVR